MKVHSRRFQFCKLKKPVVFFFCAKIDIEEQFENIIHRFALSHNLVHSLSFVKKISTIYAIFKAKQKVAKQVW